jgi:hypothetical protein
MGGFGFSRPALAGPRRRRPLRTSKQEARRLLTSLRARTPSTRTLSRSVLLASGSRTRGVARWGETIRSPDRAEGPDVPPIFVGLHCRDHSPSDTRCGSCLTERRAGCGSVEERAHCQFNVCYLCGCAAGSRHRGRSQSSRHGTCSRTRSTDGLASNLASFACAVRARRTTARDRAVPLLERSIDGDTPN